MFSIVLCFLCIVTELDTAFDPYEPLGTMETGAQIGSFGGGLMEPGLGGDNLTQGAVSWNHI